VGPRYAKKSKFYGAPPQTPLGSLQHSSLAGGRGLAAPLPKNPTACYRPFGSRASAISTARFWGLSSPDPPCVESTKFLKLNYVL